MAAVHFTQIDLNNVAWANQLLNDPLQQHHESLNRRERMIARYRRHRVKRFNIFSSGNCVPRSLSHQMFRTTRHYRAVRAAVVSKMRVDRRLYIDENETIAEYEAHCRRLAKNRAACDWVFRKAAADAFQVRIVDICSDIQVEKLEFCSGTYKKTLTVSGTKTHMDSMVKLHVRQSRRVGRRCARTFYNLL